MLVPNKLKLNRYRQVSIPRNRDYFAKYGNFNTLQVNYTGDDVAPIGQSKLDQILEADADFQQFLHKNNDK